MKTHVRLRHEATTLCGIDTMFKLAYAGVEIKTILRPDRRLQGLSKILELTVTSNPSGILECGCCGKHTTDAEAARRLVNPGRCGKCGGPLFPVENRQAPPPKIDTKTTPTGMDPQKSQ